MSLLSPDPLLQEDGEDPAIDPNYWYKPPPEEPFVPIQGPPKTYPTTDVAEGGGGGGGGAAGPGFPGGGNPRPQFNFGSAPTFDPGPGFAAPSSAEAFSDPGYQFRLQSGREALERSAAARGTLRTGGTLRDVIEYGQNFGSNEYGRAFERAASIYDRNYQGRRDAYAPRLAEWSMRGGAETAAGLAAFQRLWDQYTFGHLSAAQQAANQAANRLPLEPPPPYQPPL